MTKIIAPDEGNVYHAVYPGGDHGDETDVNKANLDAYMKEVSPVERRIAWIYFSHEWSKGRAFPATQVKWIHDAGAAPFIGLTLRSSDDQYHCEPRFTLDAIARGQFDRDLKSWGKSAARAGIPLICEWGTEMNGMWFSWNAVHNGGEEGGALFQDVTAGRKT
jgi:hypothetical protein